MEMSQSGLRNPQFCISYYQVESNVDSPATPHRHVIIVYVFVMFSSVYMENKMRAPIISQTRHFLKLQNDRQ